MAATPATAEREAVNDDLGLASEAVLDAARARRWEAVARDGAAVLAVPAHTNDAALWAALGRSLTALDRLDAALDRLDAALDAFDRARALTPTSDVSAPFAQQRER